MLLHQPDKFDWLVPPFVARASVPSPVILLLLFLKKRSTSCVHCVHQMCALCASDVCIFHSQHHRRSDKSSKSLVPSIRLHIQHATQPQAIFVSSAEGTPNSDNHLNPQCLRCSRHDTPRRRISPMPVPRSLVFRINKTR